MIYNSKISKALERKLWSNLVVSNRFARNTAVATGDAIWSQSTAYAEPATAELCGVVSSSVQDDAGDTYGLWVTATLYSINDVVIDPATLKPYICTVGGTSTGTDIASDAGATWIAYGTGAGKATITGVNELFQLVTEEVNLFGTTSVPTVNKYWNIHKVEVSALAPHGTDAGAVGDITVTSTAAGTPVLAKILIGSNESVSGAFTCPDGYSAYIGHINVGALASGSTPTCEIGCFKKGPSGSWKLQSSFPMSGVGALSLSREFQAPIEVEARSSILFKCVSATATWDVSVSASIFLVKN